VVKDNGHEDGTIEKGEYKTGDHDELKREMGHSEGDYCPTPKERKQLI
jgi:hypothetical protein